MTTTVSAWLSQFYGVLGVTDVAEPLKSAAINERRQDWTRLLTTAVVEACKRAGWIAAAKGHKLALLPQAGQEYLGLDVMAFASGPVDDSGPDASDDPVRSSR